MAVLPADSLELIDRVVEMRQATVAELARLLGGAAKPDDKLTNAAFSVWTVPATKIVRSAEMRVSRTASKARLIVVHFDLQSGCSDRLALVRKFGEPGELSVPTPRQPAGSPTYYVYRKAWGDLRVGIDAQDCVTSMVVDVDA